MLKVQPVKTEIYNNSKNFLEFLISSLNYINLEGKVLAITSKVVSLAEGQVVPSTSHQKKDLVEENCDLSFGINKKYNFHRTLKEGLLVGSAGIDQSNSQDGSFILYPANPFSSAQKIWEELKDSLNLQEFGILITDSHNLPFRRGVVGAALAYYGFAGVSSAVGEQDLFQKPLNVTTINNADALAVAATWTMGEGAQQTPLAIIESENISFEIQKDNSEIQVAIENDIYSDIFLPHIKKKPSKS